MKQLKQVSGDFAWIINPPLLLSVESFELHKKSLGEIKYHANTSLKHAHLRALYTLIFLKNSEKSGGFSTENFRKYHLAEIFFQNSIDLGDTIN